ncbi:apolipoprotein N-acyltransferase [Microbacterium sp. W4I20]|uniref:apolipoprotein N-acyltransferase n=1 Tax=Microbacterium sp. W4I20 TaxID=3042262 RepID=UPI00277FEDA8|nr:apolipoprotein N-acyltransferase [Microbacterium sp. W4I20]MDQ0725501.1 apolipoprotein N-acyltransferase [Microbacterium sp. W4I20]
MSESPARSRPLLPLWAAVIAAAISACLMNFAYPSAAIWALAFPATALILLALIGRRAGGALLVGLVYGIVLFALLVSFTSRYLGPIPWAALSVVEGGLTGIALILTALAYRWMPRAFPGTAGRLLGLPSVVAALWVGREVFVGSWPYGGFPWARIGMSQAQSPLAPLSSWLGVSGLGFLMVLLVAMLIEVVRLRAWQRPLRLVMPAALVLVLLFTPLFPTSDSGLLRIAAVQGNGPSGYFDQREPFSLIQAQTDATTPLYGEDVDLLVWPEGSLDTDPFQNESLARRMTSIATRIGAPLLANAATGRADRYFNTSMLWTDAGGATQLHDKRHPVPFGEYVPDRAFFNALAPDLIGLIQREYTPGENPPVVDVDGVSVGLAICFDVIYDDVITESLHAGAEVLVFQTNNADFRGTNENLQQLAFARMRAIESGRSVVNISTVGTSQIIRPDGTTVTSLDADEAGAMLEDVELRTGLTSGVVLGPWVQLLLVWGGLVALAVAWWRARKKPVS